MSSDKLVEITSIKELTEMNTASAGAYTAGAASSQKKRKKNMTYRDELIAEGYIRKIIRKKLQKKINYENQLRSIVRKILVEGDLSDTHPHRNTGINTLEDVLKKSIPTLRTDFKKLTTDENQRKSFRAHILKAIVDALKPESVNAAYLQGDETGGETSLLSEPTGDEVPDLDDEDDADLAALEEADIQVDIADDEGGGDKKIPIEDDDNPSPEEEFGSGLEGMDETGRNHAYTSYRKISQYILDAHDSLANPKDKKVFLDYLITNLKLYFDKFEGELQKTVEEPTTPEYDQAKEAT